MTILAQAGSGYNNYDHNNNGTDPFRIRHQTAKCKQLPVAVTASVKIISFQERPRQGKMKDIKSFKSWRLTKAVFNKQVRQYCDESLRMDNNIL